MMLSVCINSGFSGEIDSVTQDADSAAGGDDEDIVIRPARRPSLAVRMLSFSAK